MFYILKNLILNLV